MLKIQVKKSFSIVTDADPFVNTDPVFKLEQFEGKNIALHCHPASLVRAVIELDGVASSVLLVPNDACEVFSRRVEEKTELDFVLTDGTVNTEYWNTKVIKLSENFAESDKELSAGRQTRWLIATSGTTGTPKIVAHTIESLTRTTSKKDTSQELSWGLLYDPARFAGFQVVLQAILANFKLIIPSPNLDFEKKVEYLAEHGCNALSATPTLWRKILMTKAARELHLTQITLGGEIADQRVLNSLAKQFPAATIVHIFASTEAGVGFSVKDKKAGFPLCWLESGIRDVEIKVSSDGTLCLKNTHKNQIYIGGDDSIVDADGWIDTGDVVEIDNDRVLFKGRLNGAINIGGNKVMPEDIESVILEVPGVFQVAVRAKSSSIAGALVEALVIADPQLSDTSSLVKNIKQYCRRELPSFKVPAFVRLVDELPMGAAGKIKR